MKRNIKDGKIIPTDVFGNKLRVGDKIMYIVHKHGAHVLNWGEILDITWRKNLWSTYEDYNIRVMKYAERNGYTLDAQLPKAVNLWSVTCLIVGQTIPEKP